MTFRLSYPAPISYGIFHGQLGKLLGRMVANKLFKWDVLRDKTNTKVAHGDDLFLMWDAPMLGGLVQRWSPEDFKGKSLNIKS